MSTLGLLMKADDWPDAIVGVTEMAAGIAPIAEVAVVVDDSVPNSLHG